MQITQLPTDVYSTEQEAPYFSFPGLEDQALVYEALGLSYHHFSNMARIVNTGSSFLILEVENENVLKQLTADRQIIAKLSAKYRLTGLCIFSLPKFAPGTDATTRMFIADLSIHKEWAAMVAAGPLACYLYRFVEKKATYKIEQGKFRRPYSPSLVEVTLLIDNTTILGLNTVGLQSLAAGW